MSIYVLAQDASHCDAIHAPLATFLHCQSCAPHSLPQTGNTPGIENYPGWVGPTVARSQNMRHLPCITR